MSITSTSVSCLVFSAGSVDLPCALVKKGRKPHIQTEPNLTSTVYCTHVRGAPGQDQEICVIAQLFWFSKMIQAQYIQSLQLHITSVCISPFRENSRHTAGRLLTKQTSAWGKDTGVTMARDNSHSQI